MCVILSPPQYQMMFVAVVMFNANHRPSIASLYVSNQHYQLLIDMFHIVMVSLLPLLY